MQGFCWECDGDGDLIEMAFSKKKVDQRKAWLRNYTHGTFLDHTVSEVKYSDFINHELILFSRADLQRSIPGVLDGFKPGQRKILFSAFKRKLKSDLKVRARSLETATLCWIMLRQIRVSRLGIAPCTASLRVALTMHYGYASDYQKSLELEIDEIFWSENSGEQLRRAENRRNSIPYPGPYPLKNMNLRNILHGPISYNQMRTRSGS